MKTKEFIKRVEELGFDVCTAKGYVEITKHKNIVAIVVMDKAFEINCCYLMNRVLHEYIREKLFDIIVEYAKTPIDEREEETKYYLRHKYINKRNAYLVVDENQNCSLQVMGVDYELPTSDKAKFTEKEIENIKDYNKTDLYDFEMIEVEI